MALAEQAARWLRVLQNGTAQQQAEFGAWLKESPRHIEEVLCAAAVGNALEGLEADQWPDISKYLDANLASAPTTVVSLRSAASTTTRSPRTVRRPPWRSWRPGIAAVIVCTLTAAAVFHSVTSWHSYKTVVGEQRALTLDDGSLAYLNTHSQVNVRFTRESREIRLVDGEAQFKVEHDPTRPFLVRTDDAVIRAIGTQFNVYRRPEGSVVSVVEGVVEISAGRGSARVTAGAQARIADGTVLPSEKADLARTEAWRQRRLLFELDPLADVAAEFNRYNRAPLVRVEGELARAKRFSGVFDADDPKSLVSLLATYGDLAVEERADEIVIRAR